LAALASLLGHVLYGALLGSLAGDGEEVSVAADYPLSGHTADAMKNNVWSVSGIHPWKYILIASQTEHHEIERQGSSLMRICEGLALCILRTYEEEKWLRSIGRGDDEQRRNHEQALEFISYLDAASNRKPHSRSLNRRRLRSPS
jgi:hypothetical protein